MLLSTLCIVVDIMYDCWRRIDVVLLSFVCVCVAEPVVECEVVADVSFLNFSWLPIRVEC